MKKLLLILLPLLLAGCNEKLSDEDIIRKEVEQAVMSNYESSESLQHVSFSGFTIANLSFEEIQKTDYYVGYSNNLAISKRSLAESEKRKENGEDCDFNDCDKAIEQYKYQIELWSSYLDKVEKLYTPVNYTIIHEFNVLKDGVTAYTRHIRKYFLNTNYEIISYNIIFAKR